MLLKCAIFITTFEFVRASIGDASPDFQICIGNCMAKYDCPVRMDYYRWTQKECFDCRHKCVWKIVELLQSYNRPVSQFYGKWPFFSISTQIGPFVILIQEPASTLFSLMNLCACLWFFNEIWTKLPKGEARMRNVWMGYAILGAIVWTFSMTFHSRDFWLTEYLDYFAAGALIFYAFYACLMFTMPFLQKNVVVSRLAFSTIVFLYIRHVYYLFSRPNFDYDHNMICCVGLSVMTAAIYILWIIKEWHNGLYRPSLSILLKIIGIGLGSALFEVFDFPPFFYWSIDAHSLFHLATVPIPILMSKFAIAETDYEQSKLKFYIGKEV